MQGKADVWIRRHQGADLVSMTSLRYQQRRGGRWEQHTKADYGSQRGNSYRNDWKGRGTGGIFARMTPEGLVYAIIGVNAAVFIMWGIAGKRAKSLGDIKLLNWMMKHFTTMWHNLQEGRLWTLITPAFSHSEPMHFMTNMFVLYMFGADVAKVVGKRRFFIFYLGAAACGNLLSAVMHGVVLPAARGDRSGITKPGLGASTAIMGITTLFACLYPTSTIFVLFVPMPAWLAASGFMVWDIWRLVNAHRTRVDGAGHLGGALAGLGYYWFRLRPHIRRMR
ncbi:hypothetical protein H4R20_003117 [Coemansia guatemalensis]|uniref:Peptidase S54 rhomboid domain-containing protein n=1 Tax=Coemansia guatemalensis TaxID=2761395 RepID=A0A9W8I2H7_9FUNG|nr:hypothetical protein H4R20_003117 [Coemansia guatemalensis]